MTVPFTQLLQQRILAGVRAGGYPHVAAEAWGVSRETLEDWLSLGQGPDAAEPFASFAAALLEAHGQARLNAEMGVYREEPRSWLEHGPGRETEERPGWSTSAKPAERDARERNPFTDPAIRRLLAQIHDILAPHPDIRRLLAQRLRAA